MQSGDRVALLDLENLGIARMRPPSMRAHLQAVLATIGPVHHIVAAYAATPAHPDERASLLAEVGIAPLIVEPGRDAAELALLDHAHHVHQAGGRTFLVGSADHRFAELAQLGVVDVLARESQPIAAKLAAAVHQEYRLPRVGVRGLEPAKTSEPIRAGSASSARRWRTAGHLALRRGAAAVLTGAGIAIGHRIVDVLMRGQR